MRVPDGPVFSGRLPGVELDRNLDPVGDHAGFPQHTRIAGIDLAISSHPDLILCDIQLPGIDGYETATRLRSYKGLDGCPIVVLTSHGDRGLSLSDIALGAALLEKAARLGMGHRLRYA